MLSPTPSEWRKVALLHGDQRVDLAIPFDETLDDAVRRLGVQVLPGRHALLDRNGHEVALTRRGVEIDDGSLFSIVDLEAVAQRAVRRRRPALESAGTGSVWWMLGISGALIAALGFFGVGGLMPEGGLRVSVAIALGVAAAASAGMWAMYRPLDSVAHGLSMLAPLVLAFAAGVIAVPVGLVSGTHLAVAAGLLASTVVAALLSVAVSGFRLRGAAGTATIVFLALAAIWGVTLWAGWTMAAAAAISIGAAPLALRALPSMLVGVDEGYHIDYRHFMSNRWTVRGAIPRDPGPVVMAAVRSVVDDSSARLAVGTVLFSVVPTICVPLVLGGLVDVDPFVAGGTIGLLSAVVLTLVLMPRHSATPVLRWVPRAAAAVIVIEVAFAVGFAAAPLALTIAAIGVLALGLLAAVVVVPISRGAASLVWSRMADAFEFLAVVLAMPAAFLAADALDSLRGMMSA